MIDRIGEVLTWLGISALLVAAGAVDELTADQFTVLFAGGVGGMAAGLILSIGGWRRR